MKKTHAHWVLTVTMAMLLSGITGCSGNRSPEDATNAATLDSELALSTDATSSESGKPPVVYEEEQIVAVNVSESAKQTNWSDPLPAVPLSSQRAREFLDIRGVGDSGMGVSHAPPLSLQQELPRNYYPEGAPAHFGRMLDRFDPTGNSYRGDISFINWETVVGTRCSQFWAPPAPQVFAFVSHPDNLIEVYRRGFNLIGLANNHTRDCLAGENGIDGALMSARHMERLERELSGPWLWHGVGTQKVARVKTFNVKGRQVRVAFASWYIGGGDCTYVTCVTDEETVLRSLRDANADIRILAIHSWNAATQMDLVNTGVRFIRYFNGDIVFGHGPHTLKPVRIVESASGKRGVMFESLGDFIHPYLSGGPDNIIGRVLFDIDTLELRQVQVIPIATDGVYASFGGAYSPNQVPANVNWRVVNDATWRSGVSAEAWGGYANINRSED